ncbi:nitrilase [Pararhizobium polonicum]|uniref:Nitrilase n=1 Tax=Pararhizobium polonicum TaxID=1612624 RepID=A0A1C7P5G7_9HYPH|nr:carbon-nitrogen hydrolase family protein [Pararhizobium polonicum]OBZ96427.1 nitrilase [Pararhizobium polonicum]
MRVGFVEWPENLIADSEQWVQLADDLSKVKLDILVTNELPFGPWIASVPDFDPEAAEFSLACHRAGLEALKGLNIPAIISSRPVWEGQRLANEAFSLEGGRVKHLHTKQYFPAEPGWHESNWYATQSRDFEPAVVAGVSVGVLLCTEVMFNEHARHYRKQGAELIVVPRATGIPVHDFLTAGAMAAIVSGCYVVSPNRVGEGPNGPTFGGKGFACGPNGELIGMTSPENPLVVIDLDIASVKEHQKGYPCYVTERI